MKISLALLLLSSIALAERFVIYSPCENTIKDEITFQLLHPESVSKISISLMDSHNISHLSTEVSLYSIYDTPYGSEAVFIDDHRNMRSYGWCYAVDGIQPDVTMDRYTYNPENNYEISWVYGKAELKDGQWISYCTPVNTQNDPEICHN